MKGILLSIIFILILHSNIFSQWEWLNPKPQGNNLNSIESIDENNIIAVGDYGTILKTSNGGDNWDIIESGINNNLNSVFIYDQNNMWVCGNNGMILKSTDGVKLVIQI
jgi:photosystem II stability/assembly factor-like uncharacterized protein